MENKIKNKIKDKKLFIFDIDGTISLGNRLFGKTTEVFDKLSSAGKIIYLITNNSSKTPSHYLTGLEKNGIDTKKIKLITSAEIATDYLLNAAITRVFWAANDEVGDYFASKGLIPCDDSPQCILLAFDTQLNYQKLLKITELLHKGVPYFATHLDFVCPTDLGYPIPDVGSFAELIKAATGKYPDKSFGKPQYYAIEKTLRETGLRKEDAIIFGDRLYTDIALANNSGVTGALCLSGETNIQMYENSQIKADIVLDEIGELLNFI